MKTEEWLKMAAALLANMGITTARLDALVLLEDEIGKDRAWLLSHPEYNLQGSELENLSKKCVQRADHTPLAYIRGKTEFYGREFVVNPNVLEPRPESETIIDLLKALSLPAKLRIVDIGTGSGVLAITAALEIPDASVYAVDSDPECLRVAARNAEKHDTYIHFSEGDLLDGLTEGIRPNVLLCNLPYVPDTFQINTAATHEPRLAIFGGTDGLDLYRRLFSQISARTEKPSFVLTESMPAQHVALEKLANNHNYVLEKTEDFIQLFRTN